MQKRLEGTTITIPVPLHDSVRRDNGQFSPRALLNFSGAQSDGLARRFGPDAYTARQRACKLVYPVNTPTCPSPNTMRIF